MGVTANQALPRERVLRNLLPKLGASARFVESQPVFALAPFLALAEEVKSRVIGVRVLPMLMRSSRSMPPAVSRSVSASGFPRSNSSG